MHEVILFDSDPEVRLLLRTLLERDGYRVSEANDPLHARDAVRATRARSILSCGQAADFAPILAELRAQRPDLDVLVPPGYGAGLIEGGAGRDPLAELARDALLLLGVLAEEGTRQPAVAERMARLAELTAHKLGLGRLNIEATSLAAAVAAVGPCLAAFRFGASADSPHAGTADDGLSRDLRASLAAVAALRSPHDLRGILEQVEEQWDGRGRPRGLAGNQILVAARIVAVAREYATALGRGADEVAATESVRGRAGTAYDPRVVDGFFRALRDDTYVQRLEGGKRGARVMVVDGDASSLAVAELRLNAAGFRVITCADGAKAYDQIVAEPPDVVIADTVLPRLDGISLLLKLRRVEEAKNIPVIFTSSRTDAGLLNKALKLGAKDVVAKPVNFDVLVAKLRTLSAGAQVADAGAGVVGDLAEMPLTDFAQVLALGRRTVKVAIDSAHGRGEAYFEHGAPVAAFTTSNRGPQAFLELLSWPEGSFRLVNAEGAPERNIYNSLEALLLMGRIAPAPAAASEEWSGGASQEDVQFADEVAPGPYTSSGQGSLFHNPYSTPTQTGGPYQQPTHPPAADDEAGPFGR